MSKRSKQGSGNFSGSSVVKMITSPDLMKRSVSLWVSLVAYPSPTYIVVRGHGRRC